MNILYLAHNLDDAAIWRRVEMLRRGGARVHVAGFQRVEGPPVQPAQLLGLTRNGRLLARVFSVARLLPWFGRRVEQLMDGVQPDVIIARNLEMLMLGRAAMAAQHPRPILVYELLDIHRVMPGRQLSSRLLRAVEARLMRDAAQVWISSPGFETHYLKPYARPVNQLILIENKPLTPEDELGAAPKAAPRTAPAEPGRITIGWFGVLRCPWSLATLDALTRAAPGRYRVVLRGKPARDMLPDFDTVVAANPDLSFLGSYRWPDELPAIYGACDLAWLIDRYEAGTNSDWLLPNRLYEGCLHGAVPIALATTQVGRRLAELGYGILIEAAEPMAVMARLGALDEQEIEAGRKRIATSPRQLWGANTATCTQLVGQLRQAMANGSELHPAGNYREGRRT